ncbi:MAG: hypothetical protein AAB803_02935 [Patescibacteria group bacterium]
MTSTKEKLACPETEPISSFILTWDIVPLVGRLCREKGWNPPSQETFELAKNVITRSLSETFGDSKIILIDADTINIEIERTVLTLKNEKKIPTVTMDPVYGAVTADYALNTTRGLTDDGSIEEIARPGYPTIGEQIRALSQSLNGKREVYLVDAGAFSGGSLRTIIELLRSQNVEVKTVTLGFATKEGQRALWNMGVRPLVINDIGNPIDWVEARDFIPFIPLCGRVIKNSVQPGKLSIALPYILPEGNPSDWASIPPQKGNLVSMAGWNASEMIMKDIQNRNGITLKLTDFVDLPVRVSYPGSLIPELTDVLDVINTKRQLVIDSSNKIPNR